MAYTLPTVEELRDRGLRGANAELPEYRTGPGSLAYAEVATFATIVRDAHVRLDVIDADSRPDTATEAGLDRWGTDVLGVPRKGATGARKAAALEIRGTNGAVVPVDTEYTYQGIRYKITSAVTIPASEFIYADIEAIDTGPSTRRLKGESLRLTPTIAGIEQSARLVLDVDEGGDDEEPIGAWRARVVQRLRVGVQGGTRSDYEQWAEEALPALRTAYPYPNKPTLGSVAVAGLKDGTGSARALTTAERDTLLAYLETKRPITDAVSVLITVPTAVHVDVRIGVLSSAAFDWDDAAGYTVAAWTASSRELEFSPNVPPDLAVGDLLSIASASPGTTGSDGYPAVVSYVVDATTVLLAPYGGRSEPFSWTPQVGDGIYASSATAVRVRDAILNGYTVDDVFIPGINNLGPANPDHSYGDWEADVTRNRLTAAAQIKGAPGVVTVTVVTPAADVEAEEYAAPDDDQVEFFIPGEVIVRSA